MPNKENIIIAQKNRPSSSSLKVLLLDFNPHKTCKQDTQKGQTTQITEMYKMIVEMIYYFLGNWNVQELSR